MCTHNLAKCTAPPKNVRVAFDVLVAQCGQLWVLWPSMVFVFVSLGVRAQCSLLTSAQLILCHACCLCQSHASVVYNTQLPEAGAGRNDDVSTVFEIACEHHACDESGMTHHKCG